MPYMFVPVSRVPASAATLRRSATGGPPPLSWAAWEEALGRRGIWPRSAPEDGESVTSSCSSRAPSTHLSLGNIDEVIREANCEEYHRRLARKPMVPDVCQVYMLFRSRWRGRPTEGVAGWLRRAWSSSEEVATDDTGLPPEVYDLIASFFNTMATV